MGILKRIGQAVSKGLEDLEASLEPAPLQTKVESDPSATRSTLERIDAAFPGLGGLKLSAEELVKELAFYKRRSQEYFALIQKMETQREEWKSLYQRDSQGHQSAQAVLQEHIVTLRTQVVGLLGRINAHRKEKGEEPFDLSKLTADLHAFPVGIAEATAERNARDLASVAPQTDATEAIAAIHSAVPVPEAVVLTESESPKG